MCCRIAAVSLAAAVAFAGCGAVDSPDHPTSDESAARDGSAPTSSDGKADIYGEDGRREVFETTSEPLRRVADATAMLLEADELDERAEADGYRLDDSSLHVRRGVCEREPFSSQPAPGDCSGFLVGDDTLVTAGHCIDAASCEQTRVVFGFRYDTSLEESVTDIPAGDVYRCKSIIHRDDTDDGADVAVVRLDRATDRSPLDYRCTGEVADDAPLAMVGHPAGLPMKVDRGGWVVDNGSETTLGYNLDTYGGNSGSPVVDPRTGRVEAVHAHGSPDFRPDLERGCLVSYECTEVVPETRCRGNGGTRATAFAPFVLPDSPDGDYLRFTDADDTLDRTDGTVTAEIYVPAVGDVGALRVVTRMEASGKSRIGVRLVRGGETGGEAVRLLADQMFAGKWRRDVPVAKFEGVEAEGIWRIVVETDDPAHLQIDKLALEIRPK